MIAIHELRLGNYILQKVQTRIRPVPFGIRHWELVAGGGEKELFPVVLKAELLLQCGFTENKDYPLLPEAHEFILVLPVAGSGGNEIRAYIKSNKECFGRAVVNGVPASTSFYQLHQLQNLYYSLTGIELPVQL